MQITRRNKIARTNNINKQKRVISTSRKWLLIKKYIKRGQKKKCLSEIKSLLQKKREVSAIKKRSEVVLTKAIRWFLNGLVTYLFTLFIIYLNLLNAVNCHV